MRKILRRAIDTFGEEAQMIVAIEELSELQKEITKHLRGEGDLSHMAEEIADVEIMLEQLKMVFQKFIENSIANIKSQKVTRLGILCDEKVLNDINAGNDRM